MYRNFRYQKSTMLPESPQEATRPSANESDLPVFFFNQNHENETIKSLILLDYNYYWILAATFLTFRNSVKTFTARTFMASQHDSRATRAKKTPVCLLTNAMPI